MVIEEDICSLVASAPTVVVACTVASTAVVACSATAAVFSNLAERHDPVVVCSPEAFPEAFVVAVAVACGITCAVSLTESAVYIVVIAAIAAASVVAASAAAPGVGTTSTIVASITVIPVITSTHFKNLLFCCLYCIICGR